MMMSALRFEPGDKVVVNGEGVKKCIHGWNDHMTGLDGEVVTIAYFDEDQHGYRIEEDNNEWMWTDCCFEALAVEDDEKHQEFLNELFGILNNSL